MSEDGGDGGDDRDGTDRLRRFLTEDEPPAAPGQQRGRYRLERELGRGGMAVVFAATDLDLNRQVALKVLLTATSERTGQEASAAARLNHPNVVTVHEVGEDFIAMELVHGETLSEAWSRRTAEQRGQNVQDVLTVARAVAYAHQQGVIHRDIKPQNVMVERETGRLVLTDFGLAQMREDGAKTRAGHAAGTVPYMAPEQARGDAAALGPATDVWALGVMLFEGISGELPFKAVTTGSLLQLIASAPPSMTALGNASANGSASAGPVGSVIARALRHDPLGRHPNAAAFAQDLERALAAVRARRRLPVRLLLGALGATAVLLPVGLLYNNRRARAAVLETLRNQARLSVEAALELQRAGANSRMRQFLPPLEAAYRDARVRAPDLAEVEYLMGRMHRALLDNAQALERQTDALKKDARFLPALYERAVLLTLTHERARVVGDDGREDEPAPIRPDDGKEPREAVEAWRLFVEMRPRATGATHPMLTPTAGDVATAMLDYLQGRPAEARRRLEVLLARDPLLDEVWEILARAARADQTTAAAAQDRALREQETALTERLARNRGYAPDYVSRAAVRWKRADRQRQRGEDPTTLLQGAFEDLSVALEVLPEATTWMARGRVKVHEAYWLIDKGLDPTVASAAAERDLTRALELDPRLAAALRLRGNSHSQRAMFLERAGRDGRAHFAAATRDWEASAALVPARLDVAYQVAIARGRWAYAEGRRGGEAAPLFAATEQEFSRLFARGWRPVAHQMASYGAAALDEARVLMARGEDPLPALERAQERIDRAVAMDRNEGRAWHQRGLVLIERARHLERVGQKAAARQQYGLAATALAQAATLLPSLGTTLSDPLTLARQRALSLP